MGTRLVWMTMVWLGACTAVEQAASPPDLGPPAGRLPGNVVPQAYRLDLTIVPQRGHFSGLVEIDVRLREPLQRFHLHALGLTVEQAVLRLADGRALEAQFRQTQIRGVAEISLPRRVEAQDATLEIAYRAPFADRLRGLYRVRDGGADYAFTQFEPLSARAAFPGFDEPGYKTPFAITLNVARGDTAVTATPLVERTPREDGLDRWRFAVTPPLPTYLVAFAVGPLEVVESAPVPSSPQRLVPLPLRGVAAAGKGDRLGHALATTPDLLLLLEDYFDIGHPFPKLDLIAVPDFEAGAMENVGAITYRESLLLLGEDAPVQQRRRHALVNAHELAHQWFGNLVTMPWWDDIWLNEAFATWMAYRTVAAWRPDHRAGLSRVAQTTRAMREDALAAARQVRQPVVSEHDVENAFDPITYGKGSALLTMFERYLGEERFREGVREHLRRFAYGNADAENFIASLAAVGGGEVATAFRSFLFQPGIPVIELETHCTGAPTLTLKQSRYKPIGSAADDGRGWSVPLCLRFADASGVHEHCELVGPDEQSIELEAAGCPQWVLPNAGFAGYFHWSMPAADYPALLAASSQLTPAGELSIADSIDAALASGRLSVGEAGDLLARLARSMRPQVALAPRTFIEFARDQLVVRRTTRAGLEDYTRRIYADLPAARVFERTFMDALESDSRRLFLVDAADLLAWTGEAAVREAGRRAAHLWLAGEGESVARESLELALRILAEDGGRTVVRQLVARLAESRDGHERRTLLTALARVSEPSAASGLRDLVLENTIKTSEIRRFLREHVKSAANREPTWRWLQDNFAALTARLTSRDAGRLPAELAATLCEESQADEVREFLGPPMQSLTGGPRNLARAVEQIRLCARRVAVQRPQADDYF